MEANKPESETAIKPEPKTTIDPQMLRLEAENRQLQQTIMHMREQLEKAGHDREQELSELRHVLGSQISELHRTIQALRQNMEDQLASKEAAIDRATQSLANENRQLRETVQAMRQQLEHAHQRYSAPSPEGART